jgi:hypothetical protein
MCTNNSSMQGVFYVLLYRHMLRNRPRGRPKAKGQEKLRVVLRLRRETDKALYVAAGRENITKSEFVERAIEERLERLKKDGIK